MKTFIILSCLLALTSCGHIHQQYQQQHYPVHVPVIDAHGVPVEPQEVISARQSHLSVYNNLKSQSGYEHQSAPVSSYHNAGYQSYSHQPQHIPIIGHNGVPQETPEVSQAKALHFAAHAKAQANAQANAYKYGGYGGFGGSEDYEGSGGYGGSKGHYRKRRGIDGGAYSYSNLISSVSGAQAYHVPSIGHDGVPFDTPEVAAAKAQHFAAHSQVSQGGAPWSSGSYYGGGYAHQYPALGHDGQPQETPEVVSLKHAHFAAHIEAKQRIAAASVHDDGDDGQYRHEYNQDYAGDYKHGYGGSFGGASYGGASYGGASYDGASYGGASYSGGSSFGGAGHGYHIPVIGEDGVPHETPEVLAAKQQHFAAFASAQQSAGHGHGHGHGHY